MAYNPFLDCFEVEVPIRRQWHLVLEDLCKKVERAITKNKLTEVWLHLNVVDLVCQETGMYYREYGIDIIGKGSDYEEIENTPSLGQRQDAWAVQPSDILRLRVGELAHDAGATAVISLID